MRIPEGEELARLVELYGAAEARRRLDARKRDRAMIAPLLTADVSLKEICKILARERQW